ncbi:unnamed protein product, partial [Sphacelaria rigidula]
QVVSLYFVFLFWVTKPEQPQETLPSRASDEGDARNVLEGDEREVSSSVTADADVAATIRPSARGTLPMTKETLSYALTAACALCLSGEVLAKAVFGGRVSAIPLVTLVTVAGATAAPSIVGRLGPVGAQV